VAQVPQAVQTAEQTETVKTNRASSFELKNPDHPVPHAVVRCTGAAAIQLLGSGPAAGAHLRAPFVGGAGGGVGSGPAAGAHVCVPFSKW
jgi:hypothetical protein